jgi:hypothetical protein
MFRRKNIDCVIINCRCYIFTSVNSLRFFDSFVFTSLNVLNTLKDIGLFLNLITVVQSLQIQNNGNKYYLLIATFYCVHALPKRKQCLREVNKQNM